MCGSKVENIYVIYYINMPCDHKALLSSAAKWGDYCSYISPSVTFLLNIDYLCTKLPEYFYFCEIFYFIGCDCSIFAE